jgi:hypothetical protein
MSTIPVIAQHRVEPTPGQLADVERLAEELRRERPELGLKEEFRPLLPGVLGDAPTLHLDDLSEIPMLDRDGSVLFMQERACLRAGEGDLMACSASPVIGLESYARDRLGLGSVEWLNPPPLRSNPHRLAYACWEDRATRRRLVHWLRRGELTYLHPHMGTSSVWVLAALLHRASRRPVKVIAPPPGVARWANHKESFAEAVTRLFGPAWRPRSAAAANYATLSHWVAALAAGSRVLVLKLPDSAGGRGNVVLDAAPFRRMSLRAIRKELEERLRPLRWAGRDRLLVESWETDVVSTPSAQLWIPPVGQGPPVVEGLFDQILVGCEGIFKGCTKANLPESLAREMATRSWLLAALFQRLGYVGRCSFDLLLVGDGPASARLEFIECNGRWGGTSGPMTLMNRLFGNWTAQPFAALKCHLPGLDRLRFIDLLEGLGPDLYDQRTGRGWIIFYNPSQLVSQSGIQYLTLGPTWDEAARRANVEVPERLRWLVEERVGAPLKFMDPPIGNAVACLN